MKKSGLEFKVRAWTVNPSEARPLDVVALDHDNNKQHFQPGVTFSTMQKAEKHREMLEKRIAENQSTITFIRDNWPVDGVIE